jgi:hypothetical protein
MPGALRTLFVVQILATAGHAEQSRVGQVKGGGSLCIAPIEAPRGGEKSLANPSGGNAVRAYSVQIDGRLSIPVPAGRGTLVEALDLDKSHAIVIYADGIRKETIRLSFGEHRAQCLWFKALYKTWSLTPRAGMEKLCACERQR